MNIESIGAIIPAYNAGETLAPLIEKVERQIPRKNVIVVDDGSTDGTSQVCKEYVIHTVHHRTNNGKGAALKTGFAEAKKKGLAYVITIDADGQHDPSSIPDFIEYLSSHPKTLIIIGKRRKFGTSMPFHRRSSNYLTSRILSYLTDQDILDAQCGYRLIAVRVFNELNLERDDFFLESEFIIKVSLKGIPIKWIPVATIYNRQKSSIKPLRDTVSFAYFALQTWKDRK